MIDNELLTEFIRDRWNDKIVIKSHYIVGRILHVRFDDGFGEVIGIEKYYNWLQSRRNLKIKKIL
jgi:hypothetical protein